MKLTIDGVEHTFIPLKQFRQQHTLPDTFDVHFFEPKDFQGLAALDSAGSELKLLRQAMIDALPERLTVTELIGFFDKLQALFDELLRSINEKIGLKPEEIEFAVAGFGDVNQMLTYALIRARRAVTPLPDFDALYYLWLSSSVRVSGKAHGYTHPNGYWRVQVVTHIYGRVGLRVDTGSEIFYVQDMQLACPAERYMTTLLREISQHVLERLEK